MSRLALKGFDSGKPGTWPNGEPESVREAYDKQLAEQAAAREQDAKAGAR